MICFFSLLPYNKPYPNNYLVEVESIIRCFIKKNQFTKCSTDKNTNNLEFLNVLVIIIASSFIMASCFIYKVLESLVLASSGLQKYPLIKVNL